MAPHNSHRRPVASRPATTILVCRSRAALARVAATDQSRPVVVLSADPSISGPRTWFPLIESCWEESIACVAADYLTRDLPGYLRLATPEAATLLAGALHAASLVNWPVVTLAHLLDAGAVSTIVELLVGADEEDFGLDVAAAAGPAAPDRHHITHAAALSAHHLLHAEPMVTPTGSASRPVTALLAGPDSVTIAVHDDGSAIAALIIARLRYLAHSDPVITVSEAAA